MGEPARVALCVARFYAELADKLEAGAREALAREGIEETDRFDVPGAFELPLIAKYAAESGRYEAVVCLGAVIRGETDHYDYVCAESRPGNPGRAAARPACRAASGCSPSTPWSRRWPACTAATSATPAPTPPRRCSRRSRSSDALGSRRAPAGLRALASAVARAVGRPLGLLGRGGARSVRRRGRSGRPRDVVGRAPAGRPPPPGWSSPLRALRRWRGPAC